MQFTSLISIKEISHFLLTLGRPSITLGTINYSMFFYILTSITTHNTLIKLIPHTIAFPLVLPQEP